MRRAIWDFVLYRNEDPKGRGKDPDEKKKCLERLSVAEDAAGWLFWDGEEETDDGGRYTFKFICEMLDLEPSAVRARALSMTREDIQSLNNSIKDD